MNENTKTAVFVLVAAVVVIGVWITRPSATDDLTGDLKGQLLFPEFKDPLSATSLQVIKYDEQMGDVIPFEVAQVNNLWSIPSHENYPADAKDHLAAAAADLVDVKILGKASDNLADHALYGVLDPTDKELRPGTPGVGMKVLMKDKSNRTLVSMIVGKEDKDSPGLRYVRRTDQDTVVTVSLRTDRLTTDFGAWIEKDLLKLSGWDIREIYIEDYSVVETLDVDRIVRGLKLNNRMTLEHDDAAESPWKLALDQVHRDNKWVAVPMAADEELNTERLNQMKSALDELKIVDVARKPEGLSTDLAANKAFLDNDAAVQSLAQRGFYVAQVEKEWALFSNEGEVRCLTKDGVEYVLRFGNIAGSGKAAKQDAGQKDAGKQDPAKKDTAKKDATKDTGEEEAGMNRYIFVMAEFNPSPIPQPKLDPLPELPQAAPKEPQQPQPAQPSAEEKPDAAKAEAKPDAAKTEPKPDDPKAPKPDDQKATDELKAKRAQIEKENKRKQDEYEAKTAAGKKKVEELNVRFAKWYYIISEETYKQIHLGRKDIVKKKEPKPDESKGAKPGEPQPPADLPKPDDFSPSAFDKLQKGLEPK